MKIILRSYFTLIQFRHQNNLSKEKKKVWLHDLTLNIFKANINWTWLNPTIIVWLNILHQQQIILMCIPFIRSRTYLILHSACAVKPGDEQENQHTAASQNKSPFSFSCSGLHPSSRSEQIKRHRILSGQHFPSTYLCSCLPDIHSNRSLVHA